MKNHRKNKNYFFENFSPLRIKFRSQKCHFLSGKSITVNFCFSQNFFAAYSRETVALFEKTGCHSEYARRKKSKIDIFSKKLGPEKSTFLSQRHLGFSRFRRYASMVKNSSIFLHGSGKNFRFL